MAKFCLSCGDPLGTRQLMHDSSTCDACRAKAALAKPEKSKSGLLHFVEEVERHNPLSGTGKLNLPGSGPA
jgi:hypothetical protein